MRSRVTVVGASLCTLHVSSSYPTSITTAQRYIIVPRQLKAYGGTFARSVGERNTDVASDVVLQSLTAPRGSSTSLLAKRRVKTKTVDNFRDMHFLNEELLQFLDEKHITTPSPIQQSAMEVILQQRRVAPTPTDLLSLPEQSESLSEDELYQKMRNRNATASSKEKSVLLAAPHGEGKTLAYLLPIYQNMLKDRDVYKIPLRERRPRTILLAPTRESIQQLRHICGQLDEKTGLKSICFTSKKRAKYHLNRLLKENVADVLIMHPRAVLSLIRSRRLFLDDLRYIVVDEADVMLSSQHDHAAVQLLSKIKKRNLYRHLWPVQTQVVFSAPYITRKLEYYIGKRFPQTVPCFYKEQMHRPPTTLQHRFMPVRHEKEKLPILIHLLKKHGHVPRSVETEKEQEEVLRHRYKLSGTFDAWRQAHTDLYNPEEESAVASEVLLLSGAEENESSLIVEEENPLPTTATSAAPSSPAELQAFMKEQEKQQRQLARQRRHQTQAATPTEARDSSYQQYPRDPRARFHLEHVRPVQWNYLTTVAAPFETPTPRVVFAPGQRCVIFFPTIDAAIALYYHLRREGFAVSLLHAALPVAVRKEMYQDFCSGRTNILCTTDIAARGLDVHVDLVINFQMPSSAQQYLSRAGRTARMGRRGKLYSLYTKRQGVMVSAVKAFLKRALPLEGITNDKLAMTQPRYSEWRTHRINALSRSYVSLISSKTIPAKLEKVYLKHNATWRPLFRPQGTSIHAGVPERQQQS
ncbi:ATP-dependent DEAD/H RNA helicase [Angomonas deanei]|uniref:DEAD/DEAH box helicase/Helicase conserved C-terminal domain containing protein, putative n=1 Tax=Angomonas deanei TaxID=59799 RepID=A0A7G2CKN4_9TRYP|nr:ATP-dependent DEAD/H RNA helicase [Angomonas deanei]CAD2220386.1 DEAD/DEAH box helicase/Helicase conserved C-terminal domain containing protein, putative [Angomonas deanei]|eukprot:EPY24716.1 ATP-dependent DEAD/H RNA helicase [Angomonas deanei]